MEAEDLWAPAKWLAGGEKRERPEVGLGDGDLMGQPRPYQGVCS